MIYTTKINDDNSLNSTLNDMHNSYTKPNNKNNKNLHKCTHYLFISQFNSYCRASLEVSDK